MELITFNSSINTISKSRDRRRFANQPFAVFLFQTSAMA